MLETNSIKAKDPAKSWILWGMPFISIIGSIMHFVYDWSGNLTIVGLIAPINESIWEHLKLTFWPMLLWWSLWFFKNGKKYDISAGRWFSACTAALLVCPLFIVSFYYTYTGSFGIHLLLLDIASLFIGVIIAQFLALHIYRYIRKSSFSFYGAVIVIAIMITAFVIFTFAPPHIPLFKDGVTGTYGIQF